MRTLEERISVMTDVEKLIKEWHNCVKTCRNECAYTDSIIKLIQDKANELYEEI